MAGIIDRPWALSQRTGAGEQPLLVRPTGTPQVNERGKKLQNISILRRKGYNPTLSASQKSKQVRYSLKTQQNQKYLRTNSPQMYIYVP